MLFMSSCVNTDTNWSFRMLALSSGSLCRMPSFLNGDTPVVSYYLCLINLHFLFFFWGGGLVLSSSCMLQIWSLYVCLHVVCVQDALVSETCSSPFSVLSSSLYYMFVSFFVVISWWLHLSRPDFNALMSISLVCTCMHSSIACFLLQRCWFKQYLFDIYPYMKLMHCDI